jgi:hypothetical protein
MIRGHALLWLPTSIISDGNLALTQVPGEGAQPVQTTKYANFRCLFVTPKKKKRGFALDF